MSYWQSIEIGGAGDGPNAQPYLDVAHDSGNTGHKVRLIAGTDMDHCAHTELTPDLARSIADALRRAADFAESGDPSLHDLLDELRARLGDLRAPSPTYRPGTEPTAAAALQNILSMIEFGLNQVSALVGHS